jgi:hypothetical protein
LAVIVLKNQMERRDNRDQHEAASTGSDRVSAMTEVAPEERPRREAVVAWSEKVFVGAGLTPTQAQFDDIASAMADSIFGQILMSLAEERGVSSGLVNYLGMYQVTEKNVLEHLNAACGVLAIMILKAQGHEPAGPDDQLLVEVEDEIDARINHLLDLALPEWIRGVREEYG